MSWGDAIESESLGGGNLWYSSQSFLVLSSHLHTASTQLLAVALVAWRNLTFDEEDGIFHGLVLEAVLISSPGI